MPSPNMVEANQSSVDVDFQVDHAPAPFIDGQALDLVGRPVCVASSYQSG